MWMSEAKLRNVIKPVRLDVKTDDFPKLRFDLVYTANTFHIMSWKDCKSCMKLMGNRLREGARAVIYGPFKYNGEFTSESNAAFDLSLKECDPTSGIRAFEDVNKAMEKNGFELVEAHEMPANNRVLVYRRLRFVG
jgi:cyclopropane fatty-acyl-phospholipid synthase-like methyltransferase